MVKYEVPSPQKREGKKKVQINPNLLTATGKPRRLAAADRGESSQSAQRYQEIKAASILKGARKAKASTSTKKPKL